MGTEKCDLVFDYCPTFHQCYNWENEKQVSQEARRGGHHARLLFIVLASWVHTQGSSQAPPWGHSVSTKGVPVLRVFSVQRVGIDRAQALCPRTSCVLGGRERKEWACGSLNLFLN